MSDATSQQTISLAEIDGRIGELEAQRNEALARAARIAGEKAEALHLVRILKNEVDRLSVYPSDGNAPPSADATAH